MAESHQVLRPTEGITVQDSERPLEVGKFRGDEIYKDAECLGHWQAQKVMKFQARKQTIVEKQ